MPRKVTTGPTRPRTEAQKRNDQRMRDEAVKSRAALQEARHHADPFSPTDGDNADQPIANDNLLQDLATLFTQASGQRNLRQRDLEGEP